MKKFLVLLACLFVVNIQAQVSTDSLISYIYETWPDTRPYIEANDASYIKVIELDTVISEYLRVWKAYNGARLLEIHAGTNIIAIVGLSNAGGVVADTFKVDPYYFIFSKPGTEIPSYWNKPLRKLESQ